VKSDGSIQAQSGGWSLTSHPSSGSYIFSPGEVVTGKLVLASFSPASDVSLNRASIIAGPCGGSPEGFSCTAGNDTSHVGIVTESASAVPADKSFYVAIIG
jgi:hypothetical protein